ncbi:MAG: type II toxin-antitoxin system VapC family toxin [Deltaproteobacteria bacterium]|nr:type II toxin-antitoxin system VapC family toxin [Deltaproteobacteria bacterium]
MSGSRLLLDTNVVLYVLGGRIAEPAFEQGADLMVSFVTELEVLRLPDALIAATAFERSAILVTNDSDFRKVPGLTVGAVPVIRG